MYKFNFAFLKKKSTVIYSISFKNTCRQQFSSFLRKKSINITAKQVQLELTFGIFLS